MGLKGLLKRSAFAAMAAGALSVSVVAVSPATSGASTKASSSGGTATMALDETLAGFNINTSAASEFVLQEIMNMVWPQAFIVNAKLQPILNNQLLQSAVQTSENPQTVVYKLNPKAVWSDGTPITADDFIYNWQAQSGNPAYTDVGGKPYDTASSTGYNQIQSVVGSDPSGGAACAPGSTADRNVGLCPNGRTITVTFKPAFTDWRALYTEHRPGAHLPPGRVEHRLRRPGAGHLGQLVRGPELQRQPVGRPGAEPHLLGYAGQARQDRLPVLLGRQPAGAGPAERRDQHLQPVHGEPVHRPDRQPGPGYDEGGSPRPRVRALRLQPVRPLLGQGPGA